VKACKSNLYHFVNELKHASRGLSVIAELLVVSMYFCPIRLLGFQHYWYSLLADGAFKSWSERVHILMVVIFVNDSVCYICTDLSEWCPPSKETAESGYFMIVVHAAMCAPWVAWIGGNAVVHFFWVGTLLGCQIYQVSCWSVTHCIICW